MTGKRNYYFDNGKFFLIFFVVFGHFIRQFIEDNELILAIYKTIYAFHMPAFILVSGHFAKGYFEKGYILKLMKKLLVPYIIFQLIYTIYYYFLLDQNKFSFDLLNPQWSLWFLISLFCWHMLLPLFKNWRPQLAIAFTITLGIVVGYFDFINTTLSLSRTIVFFPFFLLGYFLKREHFLQLKRKRMMIPSSLVLLITFGLFFHFPTWDYEWLFGSKPYSELENLTHFAWLGRLFIYSISFLTVISFWSLVPTKKYNYTKIGQYTLYVYLLHGFVIKFFRELDIPKWIADNHPSLILILIGSLLLTYILSSKLVRTLMQPIIELKIMNWRILFQTLNRRLFS